MVRFPRGTLRGDVVVPGDKSISHRALIMRAFARDASPIFNLNPGNDVLATQRALEAVLRLRASRYAQDDNTGRYAQDDSLEIDCMNSGSTARMLLGVCAGANVRARFSGDASLERRPMEPVAAQLRAFGARIETTDGHLPMTMLGRQRVETQSFILLSPSAQVKSALLFAALFASVPIDITGDAGSRDHTERLLRYYGADIDWDGARVSFTKPPETATPPGTARPVTVAGDFSAAAFFITGATIAPQSEVTFHDVGVNPTRTGLLDALVKMAAQIEVRNVREISGEPVADIVVRHAPLRAVDIDASLALRAIDEIPLLAVAAAFAQGTTTFHGIADLRTKESDRVAAICELLAAVGIDATAANGTLVVRGGTPVATGGVVRSHDDHRIAMAAAILATAAGPLDLDDAASAAVSFPEFLATLVRIRAA